ncbi:MAG: hypothetical protein ACJAQ2_002544 [Vicingaceae bacterium]|jgi:hypothetical protein
MNKHLVTSVLFIALSTSLLSQEVSTFQTVEKKLDTIGKWALFMPSLDLSKHQLGPLDFETIGAEEIAKLLLAYDANPEFRDGRPFVLSDSKNQESLSILEGMKPKYIGLVGDTLGIRLESTFKDTSMSILFVKQSSGWIVHPESSHYLKFYIENVSSQLHSYLLAGRSFKNFGINYLQQKCYDNSIEFSVSAECVTLRWKEAIASEKYFFIKSLRKIDSYFY